MPNSDERTEFKVILKLPLTDKQKVQISEAIKAAVAAELGKLNFEFTSKPLPNELSDKTLSGDPRPPPWGIFLEPL
jgi:hypothetical protein